RQLHRRAELPPMLAAVFFRVVALAGQRKPRPTIRQYQPHEERVLPRRLPPRVLLPRHHDQVLHLFRPRGMVGRVDRYDPLPPLALGLPPFPAVDLLSEPVVKRDVPVARLPRRVDEATGDRGHMAAVSEHAARHRLQATTIGSQEKGQHHSGHRTPNRLGTTANGLGKERLDGSRHSQYHHGGLLSWPQATSQSPAFVYLLQPGYGVLFFAPRS